MKKITVAVIFGGTNTEHEVSIISAKAVIANLDRTRYKVIPIFISKQNQWYHLNPEAALSFSNTTKSPTTIKDLKEQKVDIVFPVLHGPYGEDGTIQGLLEMLRLPYVGCNVLASAICMDKGIQKEMCHYHKLPITPFTTITKTQWETNRSTIIGKLKQKLSYPLFVKPANQGSSIGITKVHKAHELPPAINEALNYDAKIIVEQSVAHAREIECAVLGNDDPQVSIVGEIIPSNEFYDYDAKYVNNQSTAHIPAMLPQKITTRIQSLAKKAFSILNCSGLARIDFLVNSKTNQVFLNELNTMPGFTPISMYPKLWQASGVTYRKLLDMLIALGVKHHLNKAKRALSYKPRQAWHQTKTP